MKNQTWNDIDEAIDRVSAATRGPWTADTAYDGETFTRIEGRAGDPDVYDYSTDVLDIDHDGGCSCRKSCTLEVVISDADRDFITHSRTDAQKSLVALRAALYAAAAFTDDPASDPVASETASKIMEAAAAAWDDA